MLTAGVQDTPSRAALSRTMSIGIIVVIVVAALGGYFVLAPKSSSSTTTTTSTSGAPTLIGLSTGSSSQTTFAGNTETNVATSLILSGTTEAAFYRQQVVTLTYTQNFACTPALTGFASNQTEAEAASAQTNCEVGGGNSTALANALPVFLLVPAFAGLSVFGVSALGATSQGFPTFGGKLIDTQCGAGGTTTACADHPTSIYSSVISQAERSAGIESGTGGLPEGVLPVPAHSQLVDNIGGPAEPWYVVVVLVFDPNIFPDPSTGQCHQYVASDLQDPSGNCLNSLLDLSTATQTTTSATAKANSTQDDPFYNALGAPQTEVVIPGGVTFVSNASPANSNLFLYFSVRTGNPYGP